MYDKQSEITSPGLAGETKAVKEEIEKRMPEQPRAYGQWGTTLPQVRRLFSHIRKSEFTANSLSELAVQLCADIFAVKAEDAATKVWGLSTLTVSEGTMIYTTNSRRQLKLVELPDGRVAVTFEDENNPSRFFFATCEYFLSGEAQ